MAMLLHPIDLEEIMGRKSGRAALMLTEELRVKLSELAASTTAPAREVKRAQILIQYAQGTSISEIQQLLGVSRPTIYKCIDKALAAGVLVGLKDACHRPRVPEISEGAKTWVVRVACAKPQEFGLAAEMWSIGALARHVSEQAERAGYPRLAGVGKSTVWRILDENQIKPHKPNDFPQKRDPGSGRKIQEVLMVYREVALYREPAVQDGGAGPLYKVRIDEKPGVPVSGRTAPGLPPVLERIPQLGLDSGCVRHGSLSILAGIDLHSGHVFARVEEQHRSCGFIALLRSIDDCYPPQTVIRVVLDHHPSHVSKETMAYLATRPGRFEYVHTPRQGPWLNLIECIFSKLTRSFFHPIRVASVSELKEVILKGIEEMNATPVVFRWDGFDLDLV